MATTITIQAGINKKKERSKDKRQERKRRNEQFSRRYSGNENWSDLSSPTSTLQKVVSITKSSVQSLARERERDSF